MKCKLFWSLHFYFRLYTKDFYTLCYLLFWWKAEYLKKKQILKNIQKKSVRLNMHIKVNTYISIHCCNTKKIHLDIIYLNSFSAQTSLLNRYPCFDVYKDAMTKKYISYINKFCVFLFWKDPQAARIMQKSIFNLSALALSTLCKSTTKNRRYFLHMLSLIEKHQHIFC